MGIQLLLLLLLLQSRFLPIFYILAERLLFENLLDNLAGLDPVDEGAPLDIPLVLSILQLVDLLDK